MPHYFAHQTSRLPLLSGSTAHLSRPDASPNSQRSPPPPKLSQPRSRIHCFVEERTTSTLSPTFTLDKGILSPVTTPPFPSIYTTAPRSTPFLYSTVFCLPTPRMTMPSALRRNGSESSNLPLPRRIAPSSPSACRLSDAQRHRWPPGCGHSGHPVASRRTSLPGHRGLSVPTVCIPLGNNRRAQYKHPTTLSSADRTITRTESFAYFVQQVCTLPFSDYFLFSFN